MFIATLVWTGERPDDDPPTVFAAIGATREQAAEAVYARKNVSLEEDGWQDDDECWFLEAHEA